MSSFPDEARQFLPAYGIDPDTLSEGPQCSANAGEFCFLCQYEADGESNCLYSSIVDLVQHLASDKRELPFIVQQVQKVYNATVRDSVSFTHEDTGEVIERPAWSKASITRHLLWSTQFTDQIFDQTVRHMLHALVYRHNNTLVDAETSEVIEDKRKALTDTLKALESWEKHCGLRGGAPAPITKRRRKD